MVFLSETLFPLVSYVKGRGGFSRDEPRRSLTDEDRLCVSVFETSRDVHSSFQDMVTGSPETRTRVCISSLEEEGEVGDDVCVINDEGTLRPCSLVSRPIDFDTPR